MSSRVGQAIRARKSWTLPNVRNVDTPLDSKLRQLARQNVRKDIASDDKPFRMDDRGSRPGDRFKSTGGSWRQNFNTIKAATPKKRFSKETFRE
jgi:hypothetical protein